LLHSLLETVEQLLRMGYSCATKVFGVRALRGEDAEMLDSFLDGKFPQLGY